MKVLLIFLAALSLTSITPHPCASAEVPGVSTGGFQPYFDCLKVLTQNSSSFLPLEKTGAHFITFELSKNGPRVYFALLNNAALKNHTGWGLWYFTATEARLWSTEEMGTKVEDQFVDIQGSKREHHYFKISMGYATLYFDFMRTRLSSNLDAEMEIVPVVGEQTSHPELFTDLDQKKALLTGTSDSESLLLKPGAELQTGTGILTTVLIHQVIRLSERYRDDYWRSLYGKAFSKEFPGSPVPEVKVKAPSKSELNRLFDQCRPVNSKAFKSFLKIYQEILSRYPEIT